VIIREQGSGVYVESDCKGPEGPLHARRESDYKGPEGPLYVRREGDCKGPEWSLYARRESDWKIVNVRKQNGSCVYCMNCITVTDP